MKFCSAAFVLLSLLLPRSEAFAPHQLSSRPTQRSAVLLFERPTRLSRLEGNQREPSDQENQLMDEMVMKLADAKPYELPNAVRRAFRVVSSPQFFLRIAYLNDKATSAEEKEKLAALSSNLVATLEVVVETTEETLDERAKEVEKVVKAAAEPDTGDFLVPLLPQQVQAMREVVEGLEPSSLDEGFLSTVDAFMNKSHQDGMDGMVEILQKCLQQYSGVSILRARSVGDEEGDDASSTTTTTTTEASKVFNKLLEIDTDAWDDKIQQELASSDELTTQKLTAEIQKTMENVVLGLENGSMAQRVQAEYLRELVTRVEAIEAKA